MSDPKSHRWDELSALADGRLAESEKAELEAHIASCSDCQLDWHDLQQVRAQLQESPVVTPPESFYRGVLHKLETENRRIGESENPPSPRFPVSPLHWFFGWPMKTFATACVLMVIVLVTRQDVDKKIALSERASVSSKLEPHDTMNETDRPASKPDAEIVPAAPALAQAPSEDMADAMNTVEPKAASKDARSGIKEESAVHELQTRRAFDNVTSMPLAAGSRPDHQSIDEKRKGVLQKNLPVRSLSIAQAKKAIRNPWKGDQSGVAEPRTTVVRSVVEWKALWDEHAGNEVPPPPAPEVDFNRYTVIAVFAGSKPSAGYGIHIKRIQFLADAISVEYMESTPASGMTSAAVMTYPFEFRLIPHTALPVRFQKQPS